MKYCGKFLASCHWEALKSPIWDSLWKVPAKQTLKGVSTEEEHRTPKLWVMFYLGTLLRTIAQETASQIALRICSKEVREEPGYIGAFAERQKQRNHVVEHQKMTANHKKQISQINDFSAFLCMRRFKVWAHWNYSFDMHLNCLGPASCFSPSWIPLRAHHGGGQGRDGCGGWCLDGGQRSLFTGMAGSIPFHGPMWSITILAALT